VDRDGRALGMVIAMHNFGAGDIIEVALDGRRSTVMLPFSEAVVPHVDVAGGRVTVELPDGTLDDERPPDDVNPDNPEPA